MRIRNYIYVFIILLSFGCCALDEVRYETIIVKIKDATAIDISRQDIAMEYPVILSDSAEECLLKYINDFYILDSAYLISSNGRLIKFDRKTGKFIGAFSRQGRSENEYIMISATWLRNDTVYLYDMNSNKILSYNSADCEFCGISTISSEASSEPFQYLIPLDKGGFVGKKVFQGHIPTESYELAYYDNNYVFVKNIGDMKLMSGIKIGPPTFSKYGNEILYWRNLENYVYSIDPNMGISTKYYIDFGNENIPNNNFSDEYDIIEYINNSSTHYASLISRFKETEKYVMFTFVFDGHQYLAVYDKNSKNSDVILFESNNADRIEIVSLNENEIVIMVFNDTDNGTIYKIDLTKVLS